MNEKAFVMAIKNFAYKHGYEFHIVDNRTGNVYEVTFKKDKQETKEYFYKPIINASTAFDLEA